MYRAFCTVTAFLSIIVPAAAYLNSFFKAQMKLVLKLAKNAAITAA